MTKLTQGYVRDDGKIFQGYRGDKERWLNPSTFHRGRITTIMCRAKERTIELDLPVSNLDIDYLVSLFPADGVCPILDMPMEWGIDNGGRDTSPSLDRIVPSLGYVKGNVAWISMRANRMKDNSTLEQLERLVSYVRGHQQKETIH